MWRRFVIRAFWTAQVSAKIGEICIKCDWQVTSRGLYSCWPLMRVSGHQLRSWRRVGFIQSGSFKREKLSNLENFINFYHEIFYRYIAWLVTLFLGLNIWGFHSKPLIVSGCLYQSHVKKFVSFKGSPFYDHVTGFLGSVTRQTTPGL